MELSSELAAAHAELSPHNLAFVETALRRPELQRRSSFGDFDRRAALRHFPLQRWPTLVGPAALERMSGVALAIHRIFRAIPRRVFGFDLGRIADFYGLDRDFAERTLGDPAGIERIPSRGDFLDSSSGLKCLEFNCGNSLGGWQMPMVADLYLDHPLVSAFLAERGVRARHRDTMSLFFTHIANEALRAGVADDGELNMAFVVYPSEPDSEYARSLAPFLPDLEASFRPPEVYAEKLKGVLTGFPGLRGGEVRLSSYAALAVRDGAAYLDGRRMHAVAEIVGFPTREVFRCYREGGLHLYSGPISMIVGDKRNLALVSRAADGEGDCPWSEEECAVIRRHVPWTRQVGRGHERYRGAVAPLPELLLAERERLVLKRATAFGGLAVHIGRATSPAAWGEAIETALADGDWIVQEYVEPKLLVYQHGEDGCCPHRLIWGLFSFGESYAGAFLRLQPATGDAIVNLHRGAATNVILELDSD